MSKTHFQPLKLTRSQSLDNLPQILIKNQHYFCKLHDHKPNHIHTDNCYQFVTRKKSHKRKSSGRSVSSRRSSRLSHNNSLILDINKSKQSSQIDLESGDKTIIVLERKIKHQRHQMIAYCVVGTFVLLFISSVWVVLVTMTHKQT